MLVDTVNAVTACGFVRTRTVSPTPRIGGFFWLRSELLFLEFVAVFVQVVPDRNEI